MGNAELVKRADVLDAINRTLGQYSLLKYRTEEVIEAVNSLPAIAALSSQDDVRDRALEEAGERADALADVFGEQYAHETTDRGKERLLARVDTANLIGANIRALKSKPTTEERRTGPEVMPGFFATLTPEQQAAALAYRGDDGHPQPAPQAQPGLTFAEFAAANLERCQSSNGFNHRLESWSTSDWFTAIMGELGEAANVAKKLNRVRDGIPGNKETVEDLKTKLRKEIGDVFIYLDLTAQALGFTIEAATVEVFDAKSAEIGYDRRLAAMGVK